MNNHKENILKLKDGETYFISFPLAKRLAVKYGKRIIGIFCLKFLNMAVSQCLLNIFHLMKLTSWLKLCYLGHNMTKEERKAYLLSKHIDVNDPIGELPTSILDIEDELSVNDSYWEHQKTTEKKLTSDE